MRGKSKNVLSLGYIAFVFLFLYIPIFILIVFSFNSSKSKSVWSGFTFDWYSKLFGNELIINSLANTLALALISSAAATLIGTAAAIGIQSMKKAPKSVVMNITYLPVLNPEIITGVSFMLLFAFIKFEAGFATLLAAHISFCIPYVILNLMPKLRQIDRYQYEAALDLGCNPYQAFFLVILPEIMPGIISGFLMAFTYSIDDVVISLFVSGPEMQTLPVTIYSMTRKQISPEINALSAIMFVVVLALLLAMNMKDIRENKKREAKYTNGGK
ncbi:MAG: ABC transporter permease [Oscillospiraceae bacterium]|nr:ABC transporter permease [Oscillospiraceae bacterium]